MPLQQVKRETTSSELLLWKVFLQKKREQDWKHVSHSDYYMAQIALETRRLYYALIRKKMKEEDLQHFILDFGQKQKKRKKRSEMTPEEIAQHIAMSKSYWGTLAAISRGEIANVKGIQ